MRACCTASPNTRLPKVSAGVRRGRRLFRPPSTSRGLPRSLHSIRLIPWFESLLGRANASALARLLTLTREDDHVTSTWSPLRARTPLRRAADRSMPTLSSASSARSGKTRPTSFSSTKLHDAAVDDRRADRHRLDAELRRVAEEQPVGDAVQALLREHAGQQRADRAADAVRRDDVERVVELRLRAPHQPEIARNRGDRRRARSRSSAR